MVMALHRTPLHPAQPSARSSRPTCWSGCRGRRRRAAGAARRSTSTPSCGAWSGGRTRRAGSLGGSGGAGGRGARGAVGAELRWTSTTRMAGPTCPDSPVRATGQPATGDVAVDEAYAGVEASLLLFEEVFGRTSYDGSGRGGPRDRALRPGLRQRVLGRHPAGLRRRRRAGLRAVHQAGRRARPRADARGHRADRGTALPGTVRSAQRVDVRRLRAPAQAAAARPDRR